VAESFTSMDAFPILHTVVHHYCEAIITFCWAVQFGAER